MEINYDKRLEQIKILYHSWYYRHLSPFGRIIVIKSLALPKLTHIVLVCPDLAEYKLKELESVTFKFLWKGKPDRLKRKDTMLPIEKGGLNMTDLQNFWTSLKASWSRRLLNSTSVWQDILAQNLRQIGHSIDEIWYGGPSLIKIISEKISNSFWKDILLAWSKLALEIPFAHPHFFFHFNIFENELFSVNGKMLRRSEFAILWRKKLFQVGDYIDEKLIPPKIMTLTELNARYNMNLDF